MEILPCQGCKGLCCGPVPVSENEVKKIKKKIQSMPSNAVYILLDQIFVRSLGIKRTNLLSKARISNKKHKSK
jgi:hypothetical protein